MGIALDIALVAILAISIILGYRKGLIKVAFSLCAFIVAILITWALCASVTKLVIKHTDFDENIKNVMIDKGVIKVEKDGKKDKKDENTVSGYINKYITVPATNTANDAIEKTAEVVAKKVVEIGVAIALFIVVRLALILLRFLAEAIGKLPIIKQFNKVGGIVYGVIRGFFIVYLILAIMFFIMSVNNIGGIANAINSSVISKYLYAHNIILDIIF